MIDEILIEKRVHVNNDNYLRTVIQLAFTQCNRQLALKIRQ